MGVAGQEKILYKGTFYSLQNLIEISKARDLSPVVDVDINWLAWKIGRGVKEAVIVERVVGFLVALAVSGFEVQPICDGKIRHRAKRATYQRIAKREKNRIDGIFMRSRAMEISRALFSAKEGREDLKKELEKCNKKAKSCESAMFNAMTSNFHETLQSALENGDSFNADLFAGQINPVQVALFQADSAISYRAINKQCSCIVSADSDFAVLIGTEYLAIREFKFSRGKGKKKKGKESVYKITDIEIGVSSAKTVRVIQDVVSTSQHKFSTPEYPLFDRQNMNERALIGLLAGSDFLVGGLKNYGAAKIHSFLSAINNGEIVYDELLKLAAKGLKMSVNEVSVFVSAFIHEPANLEDSTDTFVYMDPPPDVFPKYLKEYTNIE